MKVWSTNPPASSALAFHAELPGERMFHVKHLDRVGTTPVTVDCDVHPLRMLRCAAWARVSLSRVGRRVSPSHMLHVKHRAQAPYARSNAAVVVAALAVVWPPCSRDSVAVARRGTDDGLRREGETHCSMGHVSKGPGRARRRRFVYESLVGGRVSRETSSPSVDLEGGDACRTRRFAAPEVRASAATGWPPHSRGSDHMSGSAFHVKHQAAQLARVSARRAMGEAAGRLSRSGSVR